MDISPGCVIAVDEDIGWTHTRVCCCRVYVEMVQRFGGRYENACACDDRIDGRTDGWAGEGASRGARSSLSPDAADNVRAWVGGGTGRSIDGRGRTSRRELTFFASTNRCAYGGTGAELTRRRIRILVAPFVRELRVRTWNVAVASVYASNAHVRWRRRAVVRYTMSGYATRIVRRLESTGRASSNGIFFSYVRRQHSVLPSL